MRRIAPVAAILLFFSAAEAQSPLAITSAPPPPATVDAAYSQTFTASGGTAPYKWQVISGALPAGLALNAATGVLAGTPDTAGEAAFGIRVKDSANGIESASVSFAIQPAPLAITTKSPLPAGLVGMDYPERILAASGGTGSYTFSIAATALPPGLTLDNGVIEGIPTASGTYQIPVTVTDEAGATASATLVLSIRPSTIDLVLGTSAVSLQLGVNAAAPPPAHHIAVESNAASVPLTYTAAASPSVPWLSVSAGGTTPDTLPIGLNTQALALGVGSYQATVAVTCTSFFCSGKTQNVSIDLTVTAPPPRLKVATRILSYTSTPDVPIPAAQTLTIENTGSGTLGISSITCGSPWCTIGGEPANVTAGAPASAAVAVNPIGLAPGYYRTTLTVVSSAQTTSIPVTLLIARGAFTLTPSGAQFRMIAGAAPGNPAGSIRLSVSGVSPIAWTATIIHGAAWLQTVASSGTVAPGAPSDIAFSISAGAAQLAPQTWYGTIRIAGSGVVNSPRDFRVVLTVAPAGSPVKPEPAPAGLIFTTNAGSSPAAQTIEVFAGSRNAVTYSASATTASGGAWLSVSPSVGQSSATGPGVATVKVQSAALAQGVYRGAVHFAFGAAAVRTTSVTLIVHAATGGATAAMKRAEASAANACTPSALVPTQTGLVDNFSTPAAWPTPLKIQLSDDCGNPVTSGQMIATFSNGDPPLPMALSDPATATYAGTWVPGRSMSQIDIKTVVSAPGLPQASVEISGNVVPNAAPVVFPNSVLHVFNPQVGDPLAPGTIAQIYGANLAAKASSPNSIPLPETMGNVSVIIGGIEAPLYYVSAGQINAQIPFELDANGTFQVVVSVNGALSTPVEFQMAPATPGLLIYGDGSIIGQHQDGSLITRTSPAIRGEYVTMYLAGMGPTDIAVASGTASPGSPYAHPTAVPALTIGGNTVGVSFDGLTPSLVGLYQINFQVPANASGNLELDVAQNGATANSTILRVTP